MTSKILIRKNLQESYLDVYTSDVLDALAAIAHFNYDVKTVMASRLKRRLERQNNKMPIAFLDEESIIARTNISVKDARNGQFDGSIIPPDLQRQWIQGTGPAAKPNTPLENSIRNVAYALLSGADGWMFDGEDALGQINSMSLDNQRNLKLAIQHDAVFLRVAEQVSGEMNKWGKGFFGNEIIYKMVINRKKKYYVYYKKKNRNMYKIPKMSELRCIS